MEALFAPVSLYVDLLGHIVKHVYKLLLNTNTTSDWIMV